MGWHDASGGDWGAWETALCFVLVGVQWGVIMLAVQVHTMGLEGGD